jgi:hypothetical protein
MVEHIVCFKFKPETSAEQVDTYVGMLRGLKEKIDTIIDLAAGRTFMPGPGQGFTVGLTVRFRDKEGLAAYQSHPEYAPVRERVGEICESVLALPFEF